jgi:hypothetical protein
VAAQQSVGSLRCLLAFLALVAALIVPNANVGAAEGLGAPTYDDQVLAALALLDARDVTQHLHRVLDTNHVSIQFVPLPAGVYARYNVGRHVIEIDQRWVDADSVTLAAVIAHEATHAQDSVSGYLSSGGGAACIDSEVRAFRASALFWLDIYGPLGRPGQPDDLTLQLNSIAERQLHDPQGLEQLVRQTYSQQCSH